MLLSVSESGFNVKATWPDDEEGPRREKQRIIKNEALKLRLSTALGSLKAALSSLKASEELQRILRLFRFPFLQAAAHHNGLTFLCFPTSRWIILQYHFLTSRWIILQGNPIPLLPMLLEPYY